MQYRNNKIQYPRAMTLVEIILAMTNASSAISDDISKMSEPLLVYNTSKGMETALGKIDQIYYLYDCRGDGDDGYTGVL